MHNWKYNIENISNIANGVFHYFAASGDVISCDYRSPNHIPKANADLSVIGIAEIQSINYEDLLECLRAHPAFGDVFFQRLEGSYNLEEEEEVTISTILSFVILILLLT